jgi:hypothetical protein
MPMTDALLQLSSAQAVTATAVSTNVVDLGVARDLGPGTDLFVNFSVDTTVSSAGSYTVTFQVVSDDNSAMSSPVVIAQSGAIAQAVLLAGGAPISVAIPPAALSVSAQGERYLAARYVCSGTLTGGKFSACVTDQKLSQSAYYPSGFSVV